VERSNPDKARLTAEIKSRALQLGFSKLGIARAEPLLAERDRLKEWLARGYHGEMKWMARDPEQRTELQRIFSAARSVVVVALNYYTQHQHAVSTACVSGQTVTEPRAAATGPSLFKKPTPDIGPVATARGSDTCSVISFERSLCLRQKRFRALLFKSARSLRSKSAMPASDCSAKHLGCLTWRFRHAAI